MFVFTPEQLGFKTIRQEELWGGNTVDEAAKIFINVLDNKGTEAQRNVVVVNAAFAIQTRCPMKTLEQCKAEAADALVNGSAKRAFEKFIEIYK